MSNGGKGDLIRPTDHKKFSDNYDLIFKKKNEPVQDSPSTERPVAKARDCTVQKNETTKS